MSHGLTKAPTDNLLGQLSKWKKKRKEINKGIRQLEHNFNTFPQDGVSQHASEWTTLIQADRHYLRTIVQPNISRIGVNPCTKGLFVIVILQPRSVLGRPDGVRLIGTTLE